VTTGDEYKYPNSLKSLPVVNASAKVEELKRELRENLQASHETPAGAGQHKSEPSTNPTTSIAQKLVEGKVIEALRNIYDPELPVNIYDLGLIYEIKVDPENRVVVKMTLTAPACPVAESLPPEVERKIEAIPEVKSAEVILVWEPAWDKSRMSEAAMLDLGL
jgi:FeS assembly SUF system protein